jgi:segregation and condensation protein B
MSQTSQNASTPPTPSPPAPGRFSLERLSSAFARLMGGPAVSAQSQRPQIAVENDDDLGDLTDDAGPVTPRMIVEGLLFVGSEDGQPIAADEMAARIRNATVAEIEGLVAELNEAYDADGSPYEIVTSPSGHRLQLREAFRGLAHQCRGQVRAAKLTPAALEVLSIVAYRQGTTSEEINRLRGVQSYAILAQLVRRGLVNVQRPSTAPKTPRYATTERFNRLFGVASPADLPQGADLDDL